MVGEVLEWDESLVSKENISSILVTMSLKCLTDIQLARYSVLR